MRLGEHDVTITDDGPHEDVNVIKIEKYPGYNKPFLVHDIAILTLAHDVKFSCK